MKKLFSLILAAMLILTLAGCAQTPASSNEPLKIAVLLPSSPNDGSWGQAGAEAAKFTADALGAELATIEASTADTMKSEAESLADSGYKIIFGHGGQYASPFAEISGEYPDVYFITIGGDVITKNQFPLQIATEQCAYIQGVLAAKLSKTGKIGVVMGGDFPAYTKTGVALDLGAKAINPNIEIMTSFVTDSNDLNEAYEVAMSQISAGADFLFSNANVSSLGVVKAAKESGVYFCGITVTISEAPDTILNSVDTNMGTAWLAVAQRCLDGKAAAEAQVAGVPEGAVSFTWNEDLRKTLPADCQSVYEDYIDKITSGEIVVPGENG
ncbi:MAG: BMP family protein [Bacillota bacterium]